MTAAAGLYERVLAAAGGELPRPRPPRASASVVPWRRTAAAELEVFWIRRGGRMPFMAGWHAFPGGAVDRADATLPLAGEVAHPDPAGTTSPAPGFAGSLDTDLAPGVAAAALRELFEETGILATAGGSPVARDRLRRDLLTGQASLGDALAGVGARLDASRLTFAGRWLTPPFSPRRFDNRFFLLAWEPADGEPRVEPPENESGEWIAPGTALARLTEGPAMAAPPIVHLLRVLAEERPTGTHRRFLDTSEADLGPLRRIELRPGILLFPLAAATLPPATHTNAFLVGTGDCVLIDPGSPFDEENDRLTAALAAAEARLGRRTTEIWLSHHHPDHVAGVEAMRRRLGVPVAAHSATAERLASRGIRVDRELQGGTELELPGHRPTRLRLHATPGHARGHLAVELTAGRDLLAGDLVSGFGTIVIDPPEGDMDDYLDSLRRMRELAPRTLFPSHGAPFLDATGKLDEYHRYRLDREAQVVAGWRRGLRQPREFLPEVYPDVPAAVRPLAERQVVAHLERLVRRGAIDAG